MNQTDNSLSWVAEQPPLLNNQQKLFLGISTVGILLLTLALFDVFVLPKAAMLALTISVLTVGAVGYTWFTYAHKPAGIKNDGNFFHTLTNKGTLAWIFGVVITAFYCCLYWAPQWLGNATDGGTNTGLVSLFDSLSMWFKGMPASQWFVYGTLYTVSILLLGFKFVYKYRHNAYQVVRTCSVMFFQLAFAYLIPEILEGLNTATATSWFDKDVKNMWPLDYDFFYDWHLANMTKAGIMGQFFLWSGIAMIFVISPTLTYFFGKRWYCSWVCGCGGLAETAGDPFRHLSDKSLKAWKVERWMIHSVLVFVVVMTAFVLYGKFTGSSTLLGIQIYSVQKWYGFFIGAAFSGVVGVGFYPLLGSRVWCRFGCPMAAILGLQQRFFSRFRITTNGSQCISCGNCSTYCEMGIDVKWYAQRGQDIVRASCVGCGVCSAVCPRGVLKLENGPHDKKKLSAPLEITGLGVKVNE